MRIKFSINTYLLTGGSVTRMTAPAFHTYSQYPPNYAPGVESVYITRLQNSVESVGGAHRIVECMSGETKYER